MKKEYYIRGLSTEEIAGVAALATSEIGQPGQFDTQTQEEPGGISRMWQSDSEQDLRCITAYDEQGIVHASEIEEKSPLGQLLESLSQAHPSEE